MNNLLQILFNQKTVKLLAFLIPIISFFKSQAQAQTSKIGLEIYYAPDAYFFKNQKSEYISERSIGNLNAFSDELFGMNMTFPLKNSSSSLKVGLAYNKQEYSFGNNSGLIFGILVPLGNPNINEIDRVFVRNGYLTLPILIQKQITREGRRSNVTFSYGLITGFNVYKESYLKFSDTTDNFDSEGVEKAASSYYLQSVAPITFKAHASIGYDWRFYDNLHFLLDFRGGFYLNSPNPKIMKIPVGFGLNFGLRYDLR